MAKIENIWIGKTEGTLKELKQLWYGINKDNIPNKQDENDYTYYNSVYSDYTCDNKLTYTEQPSRDLAGNLYNEDIETFYIPSVTFSFSYVNEETYSELIQITNSKNFVIKYYDYEIMKEVIRDMYMTEYGIGSLHIVNSELKGFVEVRMSFVSRKAYFTYDELKNKNLADFKEVVEEKS